MKDICCCFFFSLFFANSSAGQELSEEELFKGKVKRVTISDFRSQNYSPSNNGSLEWKRILVFDQRSKLVKSTMYSRKGRVVNEDSYLYDAEGKLIGSRLVDKEYGGSTNSFSYDSSGKLVREESFEDDSTLSYRIIHKFDALKRKTETAYYKTDGMLKFKEVNEYDGRGNAEKVYYMDSVGNLTKFTAFEYDKNNRVIREDHFDADSNMLEKEIWQNKYDKMNRLLERSNYSSGGVLLSKQTYKYDAANNLIRESEETPMPDLPMKDVSTYTEFDAQKNWRRKVINMGLSGYRVVVREIEYY